jgi:phosphoribosylglycinamide formyltransferase-1
MRVGVLCSGGGSTISVACQLLKNCGFDFSVVVITDRICGAESMCIRNQIPYKRIEEPEKKTFSIKVAKWLYEENRVDWTALFFSRLIDENLYLKAPCINFHPSILPDFPGFGALQKVLSSNSKFFGATAHLVDQTIDGGEIIAQIINPVPKGATIEILERISFAQKIYLFLIIFENFYHMMKIFYNQNGSKSIVFDIQRIKKMQIQDLALRQAFFAFLEVEGIEWKC